jgi:phosphoenolpyruvate carboxylase
LIQNSIKLGFGPGGIVTVILCNNRNYFECCWALEDFYFEVLLHRSKRFKRKLTFSGVDVLVSELEHKLYPVFYSRWNIHYLRGVYSQLNKIKTIIIEQHQSLYLDDLESLLIKVNLFGFHFATLIRQNSRIHDAVFKDVHGFYVNSNTAVFQKLLRFNGRGEVWGFV